MKKNKKKAVLNWTGLIRVGLVVGGFIGFGFLGAGLGFVIGKMIDIVSVEDEKEE